MKTNITLSIQENKYFKILLYHAVLEASMQEEVPTYANISSLANVYYTFHILSSSSGSVQTKKEAQQRFNNLASKPLSNVSANCIINKLPYLLI